MRRPVGACAEDTGPIGGTPYSGAQIAATRAEPRDVAPAPALSVRVEKGESALKMTPLDRKFLRSLKITVEDDEA